MLFISSENRMWASGTCGLRALSALDCIDLLRATPAGAATLCVLPSAPQRYSYTYSSSYSFLPFCGEQVPTGDMTGSGHDTCCRCYYSYCCYYYYYYDDDDYFYYYVVFFFYYVLLLLLLVLQQAVAFQKNERYRFRV